MTERPILFSDAMVRAILSGAKTQTRRVLRQQPLHIGVYTERGREVDWVHVDDDGDPMDGPGITCPYGVPGDRLWVREAWGPLAGGVTYRATAFTECPDGARWRPSIHMPRWASRLTLEVTDVRVERVQAISEDDAREEGIDALAGRAGVSDARGAFCALWDSINGERAGCSWSDNPWVWVVGFRRAEVAR